MVERLVEPSGHFLEPGVDHPALGLRVGGDRLEPPSEVVLDRREPLLEGRDELVALTLDAGRGLAHAVLDAASARVADLREPFREHVARLAGEALDRAVELARQAPRRVLARRLDRARELVRGGFRVAADGELRRALELLEDAPLEVGESRCDALPGIGLFPLDPFQQLTFAAAQTVTQLVERAPTFGGVLLELGGRLRDYLFGGAAELPTQPDELGTLLLRPRFEALDVGCEPRLGLRDQLALALAEPGELTLEGLLGALEVVR